MCGDFIAQRPLRYEREASFSGSPLIRNREPRGVAAACLAPRCCVLSPDTEERPNVRARGQQFLRRATIAAIILFAATRTTAQ